MEMTLVIVTLVSLALAMAMGVIAWRLLQEERLRAAARVTALEQGLTESLRTNPPTPNAIAVAGAVAGAQVNGHHNGKLHIESLIRDDTDWLAQFPASTAHPVASEAAGDMHVASAGAESHAAFARTPLEEDIDADTDDASHESGVAHAGLFAQTAEPPADAGLSRRIAAIAAVAAVVIGAVLASWVIGRVVAPRVNPASGASVAGAATAGPAALELVSLRHEQQNGTLTITGLVRNPYGGAAQERLTAVVFFFDGQGGFLSSTRAPLDFRTLSPGEESPFQLSAPAPPNVARYRVSFRREEGAIVPHVDRRQQEASRS